MIGVGNRKRRKGRQIIKVDECIRCKKLRLEANEVKAMTQQIQYMQQIRIIIAIII